MIPALNIAVSGMLDAANRLNGAAANIVRKPAEAAQSFANAQADLSQRTSSPAGSAKGASAAGKGATSRLARNTGSPLYVPSLAEDVVAMRAAVNAYKSNAKLMQTVTELSDALLEIERKDRG